MDEGIFMDQVLKICNNCVATLFNEMVRHLINIIIKHFQLIDLKKIQKRRQKFPEPAETMDYQFLTTNM